MTVGREEGGQIARHRRVGRVGEAELLEARAAARRLLIEPDAGKEPVQEEGADLVAGQFHA